MSQRVSDSATQKSPADRSGDEVAADENEATYVTPVPGDDDSLTRFRVPLSVSGAGQIATEEQPLLSPGTMVGDYRVEGVLGQGGMGTVYAAVHPLIGKKAAIKVLRPSQFDSPRAVERFVQEARAVNQIGHLNIVDIFAFGSLPGGRAYLIMEWLDGETLAARLSRGRPSFAESCDYLVQMCKALDAAHEKNIVHRDLKPDNVFLVKRRDDLPMVKLLDFGIAKRTGATPPGLNSTETGMVMGTPGYVAPEQARGKQVRPRTDVYSLGCMTYEMFCGRLPFLAESAVEVVSMHLYVAPPDPRSFDPGIPPELAALMMRMLAKEPDARPTVAELRDCLLRLQSWATPSSPSIPAPIGPAASGAFHDVTWSGEAMALRPRRSRLVIAVIAAAVVAAVAAAVWLRGDDATSAGVVEAAPAAAAEPEPAESEPALAEPETPAASAPPAPERAAEPTPTPPTRLVVRTGVDGARVEVDGAPVPVEGRRATLELEAGETVTVEVFAPGHERFTREVDLRGDLVEVDAELAPISRRRVEERRRRVDPRRRDRDRERERPAAPGRSADPDGTIDPFAN